MCVTTSLRSTPAVRDHQEQRLVCTDSLYFLPYHRCSDFMTAQDSASGNTGTVYGLFAGDDGSTISLSQGGLSMGVFEQAVSNIAYLRAQTSGGMSRLLSTAADSFS